MSPAEELAARLGAAPKPAVGKDDSGRRPVFVCRARGRRKALGLSSGAVAKAIGISRQHNELVEQGMGLNLSTALRIAAFYGATVEELWTPIATADPGAT